MKVLFVIRKHFKAARSAITLRPIGARLSD